MQRIITLVQKIKELAEREHVSPIETDLMMDYTRVLYAELLEYRAKNIYTPPATASIPATPIPTNTPPQPSAHTIELTVEQPVYNRPPAVDEEPEEEETAPADIRDFIGINDKYQIISELFGNRKDKYEEMIDQLNDLHTELDALTWLQDNLYFEYSWSEENEALIILHNIMHHFYSTL